MIDVKYCRGVQIPQHDLWLDPWDARAFAFVSHAHSDHIADHSEIITSAGTARLMQARLPGNRREHVLEFGETAHFHGADITLLPAGHIFGSAQLHLETDAGSLLYTGDFKLRSGLSAERAEGRSAQTLIMETTYGIPRYRMPPTADTLARMVEFCREALDEGAVPVLLGYSLGKAQEILCALVEANLTPMLHGAVFRITEIYRQLRPDFPCEYVRYAAGQTAGKVLICPPSANRSLMLTRIKNRRTAVLTGWALDPGAIYRYQCDAAFPLTDHADYPDLLRYVELVQPKRVLTLHGFAAAFAGDLRSRGIDAWALSEDNQLELTLPDFPAQGAASVKVPGFHAGEAGEDRGQTPDPERAQAISPADVPSELRDFANIGEQIGATASKLKKVELLGGYLRGLGADELAIAAVFFTGRAFAQSDPRTLQVGWAVIQRALLAVSAVGEQHFYEIANLHSDAGKTAYEVLRGVTGAQPCSLRETHAFFESLQRSRGPLLKADLLQKRLATLTPLEGSYVVRILTGDLRIGLKEGLVEEAIAAAFDAPADDVREANMLLGNIGEAAQLAARSALEQATLQPFRPIKCMLASPEPTAASAWNRIAESNEPQPTSDSLGSREGEAPAGEQPAARHWTEDKFDGIRAHLHIGEGRVEIFTRDLRPVTEQFADLVRTAQQLPLRAILDGEILAFEAGRKLTFFDLQKRLGRKTTDDLFLGGSHVPVVYKAFDLLHLDGVSLLKKSLAERRRLLETLPLPPGLELAPIHRVHSVTQIEDAFRAARTRGNEGLMIKDSCSSYTPGRRGLAWLKLKKELATLDVVVVGAETGHGKRSDVLSDYTFAVRDDATGALLTIGKAYSGLTDEEIENLTEHFESTTLVNHGRYREVKPDTVLEIAFDSVQPSTRHSSGLALRFPRIKAIRRDKSPAEIDTLSYARSLCASALEAGK